MSINLRMTFSNRQEKKKEEFDFGNQVIKSDQVGYLLFPWLACECDI